MRIDRHLLATHHLRSGPGSPALRILLAFGWVSVIALLPARMWIWQLPSVFVLIWITGKLDISFRTLFRRTLLLWPFVGLTAIGLIGHPDWLTRVSILVVKAVLCVWVLTLLTQTTSVIELMAGLRRLHFPPLWVELFAFLIRYATVLSDEWHRMQLARDARTFRLERARRLLLLAHSLGALFIRAYERAERIHQAMLARGYR